MQPAKIAVKSYGILQYLMTFYLLDVVCVLEGELLAGVNVVIEVVVDGCRWAVASVAAVVSVLDITTMLVYTKTVIDYKCI